MFKKTVNDLTDENLVLHVYIPHRQLPIIRVCDVDEFVKTTFIMIAYMPEEFSNELENISVEDNEMLWDWAVRVHAYDSHSSYVFTTVAQALEWIETYSGHQSSYAIRTVVEMLENLCFIEEIEEGK